MTSHRHFKPLRWTALVALVIPLCARGAIPLNPPEAFFTNIAQRILQTMAADFAPVTNVNAIMVWPTNHYGNGLHRVMQQAANVYEATRSNAFPSVFRPLFGDLGTTNRFIVGWTKDSDASTLAGWLGSNSNGVPVVIAAKAGLPNFNEFMLRTDLSVERRLQLMRPAADRRPDRTNQLFVVGLSNVLAVESWNAWAAPFTEPSTIEITNMLTVTVANAAGVQSRSAFGFATVTNLPSWTNRSAAAFVLPMFTNIGSLSNAVFRFANNQFDASSGADLFEDLSGTANPFPLPQWNVTVSNHLVYVHRAGTNLLDVVVLQDAHTVDLSSEIATHALSPSTTLGSVWSTNRSFGPTGPAEGLRAQIQFSQTDAQRSEWIPFARVPATQNDLTLAIRQFRDFLNGSTNSTNLVLQTPFNPIARLVRSATWQANDPLVHYHRDDLTVRTPSATLQPVKWNEANLAAIGSSSLTNWNRAYAPWGAESGQASTAPSAYDPRVRDPGVRTADDWRFPANQSLGSVALGDIHRGTPWQTIYLKSGTASSFTAALTAAEWIQHANQKCVRNGQVVAVNHPINDWQLATMLTDLFATNEIRQRLLVNTTNRAAWNGALAGISTLTNILSDEEVFDPFTQTRPENQRFAASLIDALSPQLPGLFDAIDSRRGAQPHGYFSTLAALLDTPELSLESPWLNRSEAQRMFGISDRAYEMLPNQLLARLRADPVVNISAAASVVFEVLGCDGCGYDLYASTDAQNWARVSGPHEAAGGRVVIPLDSAMPQRFFRVQELP